MKSFEQKYSNISAWVQDGRDSCVPLPRTRSWVNALRRPKGYIILSPMLRGQVPLLFVASHMLPLRTCPYRN